MQIDKKFIVRSLLFFVLFIAAILRLWKLGSIPPSLTPDEASLGYNAYSILKSGKDQYGNILPIIFKSFGDYTPGLYVYLLVPFVAVLGLSEFTVRFPGVLSGILIVYVFYLLTKKLAQLSKIDCKAEQVGIIAAFLAAINPWLIYFSRGAWLPNVSLGLTLLCTYFFFRSFEKQRFLYFSALSFSLTLLVYQGAKITTALVVVILLAIFGKELFKEKLRVLVGSLIISVVITLPIVFSFFQGKTGRLNVISIFSYSRPLEQVQELLKEGDERIGSLSYYLYHSEDLNYFRAILGRWFNTYSARFLFFEGDWENPRHGSPYMGVMLLTDVVLILSGLFVVIKNLKNKYILFIFLLLIFTPLPAALSRDSIHAVRSFHLVIPLIIMMALGVAKIFNLKTVFYAITILYLINYLYFLDSYFVHLPVHNAKYWDYGYRETVEKVLSKGAGYNKIVFQQSYEQPFIYFLFYGAKGGYPKYTPNIIQQELKLKESKTGDVGLVEKVNDIQFKFLSWPVYEEEGALVIVDGITVPRKIIGDGYEIISEVKYPDGINTAFNIIEVKKK